MSITFEIVKFKKPTKDDLSNLTYCAISNKTFKNL